MRFVGGAALIILCKKVLLGSVIEEMLWPLRRNIPLLPTNRIMVFSTKEIPFLMYFVVLLVGYILSVMSCA